MSEMEEHVLDRDDYKFIHDADEPSWPHSGRNVNFKLVISITDNRGNSSKLQHLVNVGYVLLRHCYCMALPLSHLI